LKSRIKICMGSSCFRRGNRKNLEFIEAYIEKYACDSQVELIGSRCEEECCKGPNIQIDDRMYHGVNEEILFDLLKRLVGNNRGE